MAAGTDKESIHEPNILCCWGLRGGEPCRRESDSPPSNGCPTFSNAAENPSINFSSHITQSKHFQVLAPCLYTVTQVSLSYYTLNPSIHIWLTFCVVTLK